MEKIQENIMLITPNTVATEVINLGSGVWVTTPWEMDERKIHEYRDGTISLHNHKKETSYCAGKIIEVVNLGSQGFARNRVAFVFRMQPNKTVNPATIRRRYQDTLTESREQVRY